MRIWMKFLVPYDDGLTAEELFACAAGGLTQTASGHSPEPSNAAHFSPPAAGLKLTGGDNNFPAQRMCCEKIKPFLIPLTKKFFVSE